MPTALQLEKDHRLGAALPDYAGWDLVEHDPADPAHRWCWSRSLSARAFLPVQAEDTALHIVYSKITPALQARILLDGREAYTVPAGPAEGSITLPLPPHTAPFVTVTFVTDRLCRPCDLGTSADPRALGIALHSLEACRR